MYIIRLKCDTQKPEGRCKYFFFNFRTTDNTYYPLERLSMRNNSFNKSHYKSSSANQQHEMSSDQAQKKLRSAMRLCSAFSEIDDPANKTYAFLTKPP